MLRWWRVMGQMFEIFSIAVDVYEIGEVVYWEQ
jgi:hypothetical protein